jgi:hypothetical protein
MRDRVNAAREMLAKDGINLTNADMQAIWWYPEKNLYAKLGGRSSENINVDYATALADFARSRGVSEQDLARAMGAAYRRPRSTGGYISGGNQGYGYQASGSIREKAGGAVAADSSKLAIRLADPRAKRLIQAYRVDRSHDIPYVAGISNDGRRGCCTTTAVWGDEQAVGLTGEERCSITTTVVVRSSAETQRRTTVTDDKQMPVSKAEERRINRFREQKRKQGISDRLEKAVVAKAKDPADAKAKADWFKKHVVVI